MRVFRICVINSVGQGTIDSALPKLVFSLSFQAKKLLSKIYDKSDCLRLSTGHFCYMYHSPLFWCSITPVSIQFISINEFISTTRS